MFVPTAPSSSVGLIFSWMTHIVHTGHPLRLHAEIAATIEHCSSVTRLSLGLRTKIAATIEHCRCIGLLSRYFRLAVGSLCSLWNVTCS
jgi:hypothetical protein